MTRLILVLFAASALSVTGCATTSSSTPIVETGDSFSGPVFVTQSSLPSSVDFVAIGTVEAKAQTGYDGAASLYPLLAEEARKLGANAVINAVGGRRLTAFSWSAAYVSGTAIKVEDQQDLKGLPGSFH